MYDQNLENRIRSQCQRTDTGCLEWQGGRHASGYGLLWLGGTKGHRYRVHRLMFEIASGPIPKGMEVLHSCDNPSCCEPSHLRAGTHIENCRDITARGRHSKTKQFATRFPKGKTPNPDEIVVFLANKCYTDGEGCLIWNGHFNPDGYGQIRVKGKDWRAHRLMYEAYNHATIEHGKVIMHTCDKPLCIEPTHLKAVWQSENVRDASAKKRIAHGETHGGSRLTNAQVLDIIQNYNGKASVEVGPVFGVKPSVIDSVRNGSAWSNITGIQYVQTGRKTGDEHWTKKYAHLGNSLSRHPENRSRSGNPKLTPEQVEEIRALLEEGQMQQKEIAKQFSVSTGTVFNIKNGVTWKKF